MTTGRLLSIFYLEFTTAMFTMVSVVMIDCIVNKEEMGMKHIFALFSANEMTVMCVRNICMNL